MLLLKLLVVVIFEKLILNPISESINTDDPEGLIEIADKSPPKAPKAPPIELNLALPLWKKEFNL